jgi:TonB-linked SusC/RagA family outer membrane protein
MNKEYIKIIVALMVLNILFQASSFAQKPIVVKDESGNPVSGVLVTIGEGSKPVLTNEKGEFVLNIEARTLILIEAEGFQSQTITVFPAIPLGDIVLIKSKLGSNSIKIPFGTYKMDQIPAAVASLTTTELLKNDQGKNFYEAIIGRIPGYFGSADNRGLGAPLVVVDGVPRSGDDYNLQMIDQITVGKDLLTSMLYGGQAKNGVIYITTKRGIPLNKNISFTLQSGVNDPISYPDYLSAGDYMTLYNEALANDNLPAKYTQTTIDGTISGDDPVQYPDENYYNSTYLKNYASYFNFVGEANGGNDVARYYLNVGLNRSKGILKLGEGGNQKNDRINVRGNVDYQLNKVLKIRFDGAVIFNILNQPRYTTAETDFWTLSSTLYPNNTPVLIPASLMNDQALLGAAQLVDGEYLLGGTSEYLTNIYGELTRNGPEVINNRLLEMNIGLDFNLTPITEGLSASLFFTYDLQNVYKTDILNSYAVYDPVYTGNNITSWSKYNVDVKVNNQTLADVSFARRNGLYGKIDYHKISGDHEINVNALGYFDQYTIEGILQPTKHLNMGIRANYMYKQKFVAEATGVLSGSTKLNETMPWAFSPGIGLGWILTKESFLENNNGINYLKLRANLALTKNEETLTDYFPGHDYYISSSVYQYNHGGAGNNSRLLRLGNENLGPEKRLNFNIGFDGLLLNNKLSLEGSWFYYKTYDIITQKQNSLPTYFGSYYYENYGSTSNTGIELGAGYTENIGDVRVRIGSNITYAMPKTLVVDELNYKEEYRKAAGKPTDAMFGFVALGLFSDQTDINNSVPQTFGTVKPGDIKYEDLNNDGVIDDLDQKMIGNSHSRIEYSFNLSVKYKSLELFALATGQSGGDTYYNNAYYWIYGSRKYSEVVRNRWTPATATTADYPRLTTLSNENNFRNSTFWLYEKNWFTLQTLQLTYTLPSKITAIKEARFFVRANNLLTMSEFKDRLQLNIGTSPQTRFYALGVSFIL